jgi:hypothetical protein
VRLPLLDNASLQNLLTRMLKKTWLDIGVPIFIGGLTISGYLAQGQCESVGCHRWVKAGLGLALCGLLVIGYAGWLWTAGWWAARRQ